MQSSRPRAGITVEDALSGRAGIEGVQSMLVGSQARGAVEESVAGLLETGASIRGWRLHRAKFKPDRRLNAHFEVTIRDDGRERVRPVVVNWTLGGGRKSAAAETELNALEAHCSDLGLSQPFRRLHADVPEWHMSVLVSPLDPGFPQLAEMSDPAQVRTMLATMLAEAGDGGGYDVATIRYRPGERHVLRYDPASAEGATVFAKMSRGHDVGVEHRVAERAAAWAEDLHVGVHAARPLAHLEREEVLLYPRAAGEPLSALFLREGAAVDDHLRRTGAALRAMHDAATGPELELEDHDFHAELKSITRAGEHVARLLPDAGVILEDVVGRAAPLYAALPAEPATFVHGDFKADHLLIDGDDLTVLDFGTCKSGDPALDLGKFAADLHFWYSLSGDDDVAEARGGFFDGYGDAPPGRLLRAGVYESLILLKSTVRRVPLFQPQWADRTAALIRRADQLLSVAEAARTTAS